MANRIMEVMGLDELLLGRSTSTLTSFPVISLPDRQKRQITIKEAFERSVRARN